MPEKELKRALPEIKKKISSYINLEEGKITKQSLITVGAFVASAAAASAFAFKLPEGTCACNQSYDTHKNSYEINYNAEQEAAIGRHSHHGSHCNRHCSY